MMDWVSLWPVLLVGGVGAVGVAAAWRFGRARLAAHQVTRPASPQAGDQRPRKPGRPAAYDNLDTVMDWEPGSTRLLTHAERLALDLGYADVRLYTNRMFEANVRLYLAFGYRIDREETSGKLTDMPATIPSAAFCRTASASSGARRPASKASLTQDQVQAPELCSAQRKTGVLA